MALYDFHGYNGDEDPMDRFVPVPEHTLEDPICPCCYVEYGKPGSEGEKAERPLKILCGHVFGDICLDKWLPNNSCPMCRRKLFDGISIHDHMSDIDSDVRRMRVIAPLPRTDPTVRQITPESGAIALARGDDSIFVGPGIPRFETHRWWRLYQQLGAEVRSLPPTEQAALDLGETSAWRPGRNLYQEMLEAQVETEDRSVPRTEQAGLNAGGFLTWEQDRVLFRELQQRGAFDYPGMREQFEFMPDERIYQRMQVQGACWGLDEAWTYSDGTVLWNSAGDGIRQVERS